MNEIGLVSGQTKYAFIEAQKHNPSLLYKDGVYAIDTKDNCVIVYKDGVFRSFGGYGEIVKPEAIEDEQGEIVITHDKAILIIQLDNNGFPISFIKEVLN